MLLLVALLMVLALPVAARAAAAAPVKHVFLIVLENEDFRVTFGPKSAAPYLARTLPANGAMIRGYYGVTHLSHGNYTAMISGQGNNLQSQLDCLYFTEFEPGLLNRNLHFDPTDKLRFGRYDQALGGGCVFPTQVKTVADQLAAKGLTWKGYMDDMASPCLHPRIGAKDDTVKARPGVSGGLYAVRHNPFVYFHSIIDSPACAQNVVPLNELPPALTSVSTTPTYSFIVPDLCNDGHDDPCPNGQPGGLVQVDTFLMKWVPLITSSPAYKQDGLLVVVFDEAGSLRDSRACCDEQQFPNTPNNGFLFPGRGGGHVGAVALSPFIKPGTRTLRKYNHFSLLKTIEQFFGLEYLGYAGQPGLRTFGTDIFTARRSRRPNRPRPAPAQTPIPLPTGPDRQPSPTSP